MTRFDSTRLVVLSPSPSFACAFGEIGDHVHSVAPWLSNLKGLVKLRIINGNSDVISRAAASNYDYREFIVHFLVISYTVQEHQMSTRFCMVSLLRK